jgi:hypothetical protein
LLPVDGEKLVTITKPELAEAVPARPTGNVFSAKAEGVERETGSAEITAFIPFASSRGIESASAAAVHGSDAVSAPVAAPIEKEIQSRVLEFRRLNAESMSVVMRPDANTEIQLSLRLIGDQVEVFAHWTRGDASLVQSHWSQMQESLASQGIRLAAMSEAPSSSGFGQSLSNGFQQAGQQPESPEQRFDWEPLTAAPGAARPSSRTRPRSNQPLLESWA